MNPEYLFIVNPHSGAGRGKVVARLLKQMLPNHPGFRDGKGRVFSVSELDNSVFLESRAHAEAFIAVGGDGTASRLIPHILACDPSPALGVIPLGTSNDLARALGVSVKDDYAGEPVLRKALDSIPDSEEGGLDIFCVNGRLLFCNYFSIGLDAAIVRDFDRIRGMKSAAMIPQGRLTNNVLYFLMGLKNLWFRLAPEVRIEYEDGNGNGNGNDACHMTIDSPCRTIIISNLPIYAGGCRIRPDALKDDGAFEITVVRSVGQYINLILTRFLPFLRLSRGLGQYRARRATIHLTDPAPCQIDGEKCSQPEAATPDFEMTFHVNIRILMPPGSSAKTVSMP